MFLLENEDPESPHPMRARNEYLVIVHAKLLRQHPHCLAKQDPQNKLVNHGWSALGLSDVLKAIFAILVDRWCEMPDELFLAMEFLTTDKRIQKILEKTTLSMFEVHHLFKALDRTLYPKLFSNLLKEYARTDLYIQASAAKMLEKFEGIEPEFCMKHVVFMEMVNDVNRVFNDDVLHMLVCKIVTKARDHNLEAILMWRTMFENQQSVVFHRANNYGLPKFGMTTCVDSVFRAFCNTFFLAKDSCDNAKIVAIEFLTSCIDKQKHTYTHDFMKERGVLAVFSGFLQSNNLNLSRAAFNFLVGIGDRFYGIEEHEIPDCNLPYLREKVTTLVREFVKEGASESLNYLEGFYTLNFSFHRKLIGKEKPLAWWLGPLSFSNAVGIKHRTIYMMSKAYHGMDNDIWNEFKEEDYKELNYGLSATWSTPIEQQLGTTQVSTFLDNEGMLTKPEIYLKGVDWDLDTLRTILHYLTMMQREKAAKKWSADSWNLSEFSYRIGEMLLNTILNPGYLTKGAEMFRGDYSRNMLKYENPFIQEMYDGIEFNVVRRELNNAAKKAMESRDMEFENILEQVINLLEISLLTTDRDLIIQDENYGQCIHSLIRWFPLLACRLSVAVTRVFLDPTQFEDFNYKNQELWEMNYEAVTKEISHHLPYRLKLVTEWPTHPKNLRFMFENEIGNSVYDHHLFETHEFKNWLTMRAFCVGTPDFDGIYTL